MHAKWYALVDVRMSYTCRRTVSSVASIDPPEMFPFRIGTVPLSENGRQCSISRQRKAARRSSVGRVRDSYTLFFFFFAHLDRMFSSRCFRIQSIKTNRYETKKERRRLQLVTVLSKDSEVFGHLWFRR